jgi:hypothetical protein
MLLSAQVKFFLGLILLDVKGFFKREEELDRKNLQEKEERLAEG